MSKNIVICLDGTWNDNDNDEAKTNVVLLYEMSVNDGVRQVTYYDRGVGTDGWYDKKLGGVHGIGLSQNIREAYTYLIENQEENDKVYIFGFSRGAYTARSLAGLLYRCGLLSGSENRSSDVKKLYDAYKDKDQDRMGAYKAANRKCPIEMLGVWDTVGALGIPVSFLGEISSSIFSFHDTNLSPEVKLACHAVAADEKRASFGPSLWQETTQTRDRIKQVWFPGVHSDVGGGYKERHHSDVALKWMVEYAQRCGLLFKEERNYKYRIDLQKDIHESAFNIFRIELNVEPRDAPPTAENTPVLHSSIREKITVMGNYRPLAFKNHIDDFSTLLPYVVEG